MPNPHIHITRVMGISGISRYEEKMPCDKCDWGHISMKMMGPYAGFEIIADESIPEDGLEFRHPDGRVHRFTFLSKERLP